MTDVKENLCQKISVLTKELGINGVVLQHLLPSASYAQANAAIKKYTAKAIPEAELRACRRLLIAARKWGVFPVSPRSNTLLTLHKLAQYMEAEDRYGYVEDVLADGDDITLDEVHSELSVDQEHQMYVAITKSIENGLHEADNKQNDTE